MNSKYLHIFSKVLAKRKITKCLMGHMAHITIFGFFFLFFLFYRSLNSGREGCIVRKKLTRRLYNFIPIIRMLVSSEYLEINI